MRLKRVAWYLQLKPSAVETIIFLLHMLRSILRSFLRFLVLTAESVGHHCIPVRHESRLAIQKRSLVLEWLGESKKHPLDESERQIPKANCIRSLYLDIRGPSSVRLKR